MSRPPTFAELFDPGFLATVSRWSLAGRRVSRGGRHGGRLSPDRGAGIEFKDYRPYSPGDDLRAIDWNLYRRLGKVFIRLFEEEQNLPLYLMPDVSGSMFFAGNGVPPITPALRTTLALATIGLEHHDTAGLFPFGEQLDVLFRGKSGHTQVMSVARHLARLAETRAAQRTDLTTSVHRFAHLGLRRGLLVVISDFFDPGGIEAIRRAFQPLRHRTLLVRIVRPSDANPELAGDVRVTDCETQDATNLSITPWALERYRELYRQFGEDLVQVARRSGGQLLEVSTEQPLIPQLAGWVQKRELCA
jgi:uncharacterized protein (DUF58 family)